MKIIDILLEVIIFFELVLLMYYLLNKNLKRDNKILLLFYTIVLFIIVCFYIGIDIFSDILKTNTLILLLVSLITIIVVKLTYNFNELDNRYNKLIKCLIEYEKIIEEQGKKNHEYNNQLMILKGYINKKGKLEKYLNNLISEHHFNHNYNIRQLANFPNGGLKEMLYYKIERIKENNIKYYLYIEDKAINIIENFSLEEYKNITKVFGVLIDNAIEASIDSKEKKIYIDFSLDNNYIVISISNSYNEKLNIKNIRKIGFSTKGKGRGFGLILVRDIIRNNKNFELFSDYDNDSFIQTFLIDVKCTKNVEFLGTKKDKKDKKVCYHKEDNKKEE